MCFRPTIAAVPKVCEECGAVNQPEDVVCKACGAELSESDMMLESNDDFATMPAPSAPSAPSAPNTPRIPSAPSAPKG